MRGTRRAWPAVVAALAALAVAVPADAYDTSALRFGTYPEHGFIWMARYPWAPVFVSSDRCKSYEQGAWNRIESSTAGKGGGFGDRWPEGLEFNEYRCDGRKDAFVDVRLNYMKGGTSPIGTWCERGHCDGSLEGRYGGENHGQVAPSSWCEIWGLPPSSRCGMHAPYIHLNEERIDSSIYSRAMRERLLIHETGHSLGFRDYCGGSSYDGIMENGAACNNNGAWSSRNWTALDRDGQYDTYPRWPYHD